MQCSFCILLTAAVTKFHFGLIFSWNMEDLTFSTPPGLERQKDKTGDGGKQFPSPLSGPADTRSHSADKL